MERALSSFVHGEERRITGRQPRREWDGKWHYPSLVVVMKEAGFTKVRTSITRSQNMVAQFIATRPFLNLCEETTQRGRDRVTMRWWDQKGIDWEKAKSRGVATESESESEADEEGGATRDADSRASGSSGAEWSGAIADEWEAN